MKRVFIKCVCSLMFLGGIMLSCKENQENIKDQSPTTEEVAVQHIDSASTGSDSAKTGTETSGSMSNHGIQSAAVSSKENNGKASKKKSKPDGYSAPDRTDAENHDGDQYTKNDNTRRPSGPPIK